MSAQTCGGCEGLGSHRRWCVVAVGYAASRRGIWSEKAEALADEIGCNEPGAANLLYHASSVLLRAARETKAAGT